MAGEEFSPRNLRTILARGSRTSHPTASASDVQITKSKGVKIHVSLEEITGTSITVTFTEVNPVTGRVSGTVLASAALTGVGNTTYTIAPGVTTVSNVSLGTVCPRILRTTITGTITTYDVSIVAELVD